MKVLITGSSGYLGSALVSALRLQGKHELTLCDNDSRNQWVKQVGGCSLTRYGQHRYWHLQLHEYAPVYCALNATNPDVIIHLASQPSGPFSEISSQARDFTQKNNVAMMENLLNASHDLGMSPKFIVATTTGVAGAPGDPIIEGYTPNGAGSEYHMTRGWDSDNCRLAVRQWGFNVLELRTSIVYGVHINGHPDPVTRFDWDHFFGTVVHRFILRKKKHMNLPVNGKGEQKKPFISLRDCVDSFVKAIDYDVQGHEIMNQTTECLRIVDVAKSISTDVRHIPNPRVENEGHQMVIHNEKFLNLLGNNTICLMKNEIPLIEKAIDVSLLPEKWHDVFDGKIQK